MVVARIHPNTNRIQLELEIPMDFIDKDLELDMHTVKNSGQIQEKGIQEQFQAVRLQVPEGYRFNREDCYNHDIS